MKGFQDLRFAFEEKGRIGDLGCNLEGGIATSELDGKVEGLADEMTGFPSRGENLAQLREAERARLRGVRNCNGVDLPTLPAPELDMDPSEGRLELRRRRGEGRERRLSRGEEENPALLAGICGSPRFIFLQHIGGVELLGARALPVAGRDLGDPATHRTLRDPASHRTLLDAPPGRRLAAANPPQRRRATSTFSRRRLSALVRHGPSCSCVCERNGA